MKSTLRFMTWLLGLVPLGLLPATVQAEGSKQLTPNTAATTGVALDNTTNTRSGWLEHDANFANNAAAGNVSAGFLKPSTYNFNGVVFSPDQRLYVRVKANEYLYYGVHRINNVITNANQNDLTLTLKYGAGAGTQAQQTVLTRDQASTTQSLLNTTQPGVIDDATQNRFGPSVTTGDGGYDPLVYQNTTGADQDFYIEFTQDNEAALGENARFSTYDFWDFTVRSTNTAAGAERPGRLYSKQWAFCSGSNTGVFSATFSMFPLIPSVAEVNKFFVKRFDLAGINPQNFFRFTTNSKGTTASATDFSVSRKSQVTAQDYPEYSSYVNDPDNAIWPSATNPTFAVNNITPYCAGANGGLVFTTTSSEAGQLIVTLNLDGVAGYQAGGADVFIERSVPAGKSSVGWNGRNGLGAAVAQNTTIDIEFKSSVAPLNFPLVDCENNVNGFTVATVRPGTTFNLLFWDDSNLDATLFPAANTRVEPNGQNSSAGVHRWGAATGATADAGNLYTVNTYTYVTINTASRSYVYNYVCDKDADGVADNLDIDKDNDGITDTNESGGINPVAIADNVPTYLNATYVDAVYGAFRDANNDGINDIFDLDLDGIPNFLDIDADGDGIPDTIEANGGIAPTGYDASLSRFPSTGVGANGMPDVAETAAESGITKLPVPNTDAVGRPDFLDIDADNDGIVDNIEAQLTAAYRSPSGTDTDGDGLDNIYDLTPGGAITAGVAVPLTNTDGTDSVDYLDTNSDNDARLDAVEGWDTNNDGVAEKLYSGIDADGDGLDDAYDASISVTSFSATNSGQTPQSFPDVNKPGGDRDWRQVLNVAPVAQNIVNAPAMLASNGQTTIQPLVATDADGTVATYKLNSIPTAGTQGVLYYNNAGTFTAITTANFAALSLSSAQASTLRFAPVGNSGYTASFTYSAIDNDGLVSNVATYQIPVVASLSCQPSYLDNATTSSGLTAEYYAGYFGDDVTYFQRSAPLRRLDPNIDFTSGNGTATWGDLSSVATNNSTDWNNYSSRYRGSIYITTAGSYTFYLNSDDASYLWLDGAALAPTLANALVSVPGQHPVQESSGTITLSAGLHDLTAVFGEFAGGNYFRLEYASAANNIARQVVPQSLLCAGPAATNNAPVANDATNTPLLNTAAATVLSPNLSGTDADGNATISIYNIETLPSAASGVLSYNGTPVVVGQAIPAGSLNLLTFDPAAGFSNNAVFTYSVTDNAGRKDLTPATYTIPVSATYAISGTVFEDVNYGGGTGRNLSTANASAVASGFAANAIGRSGATVELYDNATGLLASNGSATTVTSGANGAYTFTGVPTGSYTVRVVNSTVTSTRPGAVASLVPVQTFRTNNGAEDGNRVGGENPAGAEGGPAPVTLAFTGQNLSGDNTIFIDNIEVLQGGTALATNPISNPGFETGTLSGPFQYNPTGTSWTYNARSGIQANNSAFTPPNTTSGARAGFVQSEGGTNGVISQTLTLPAGTYTLRFQAANRTFGGQQSMNVTVNGITVLANVQAAAGTYATYQTATFTVTGAQSIAPLTVAAAAVTGVDFGYNFSTITNTNDAGQGSLRQFITNSNALTNANLNQVAFNNNGTATGTDPAAGVETSIFMIADGRTTGVPAGLRSGVNGGFVGNTATVTLATALPTITDSNTALDGSKQTTATGDNVAAVAESTTGPEVIINFNAQAGLLVTGGTTRVASLGLNNANGGTNQGGAGVTLFNAGASNSTVTDVTTSGNNRTGVRVEGGVANVTVSNNVLNNNIGISTQDADGLELLGSTLATVSGNTISNNKGYGIFMTTTTNSGATISNNIIRNNGTGTTSADAGISIGLQSDNNLFLSNTITGNAGDGIVALAGAQGNRFSQNNTSSNGNLGIDLSASATVTGDGVSLNADGKTTASGANSLLNFPVFTQATINAGRLFVSGYVKAGATVELFVASTDPTNFGEGSTYSFSATEGSTNDTDARSASYSGATGTPAGSPNQGSETGVSRFIFSFPVTAAQITAFVNNKLTATATVPATVNGVAVGNTSEFSAVIVVTNNRPLPVELELFTVTAKKADALLAWTTASEKNNDHFDVERSLNGTDFVKIAAVKGQGSSSVSTSYTLTDAGIGNKASAPVYYRLRQVDTDGTATYSPVRTVTFAAVPALAPAISLFPNPATTGTQLDLTQLPIGRYQVSVLDATGRTVLNTTLEAGLAHALDLNTIASGTYTLLVRGQANGQPINLTKRLIKE